MSEKKYLHGFLSIFKSEATIHYVSAEDPSKTQQIAVPVIGAVVGDSGYAIIAADLTSHTLPKGNKTVIDTFTTIGPTFLRFDPSVLDTSKVFYISEPDKTPEMINFLLHGIGATQHWAPILFSDKSIMPKYTKHTLSTEDCKNFLVKVKTWKAGDEPKTKLTKNESLKLASEIKNDSILNEVNQKTENRWRDDLLYLGKANIKDDYINNPITLYVVKAQDFRIFGPFEMKLTGNSKVAENICAYMSHDYSYRATFDSVVKRYTTDRDVHWRGLNRFELKNPLNVVLYNFVYSPIITHQKELDLEEAIKKQKNAEKKENQLTEKKPIMEAQGSEFDIG